MLHQALRLFVWKLVHERGCLRLQQGGDLAAENWLRDVDVRPELTDLGLGVEERRTAACQRL